MRASFSLLVLSFFAGCGGEASSELLDAALVDAACGDAPECAIWLQDYQREVVAKLSGHAEISPGFSISARFSEAERSATREYIFDELSRFGMSPERHNYGTGTNIVVRLPATRGAASTILLGAHYDGIEGSPAAGDDGTGVALVLAAARFFHERSVRDNAMILAFFDEEEDGLIGSQAYAEKLRSEVPDLAAAHIFDLISWDADEDGAVELWSPGAELEARYRQVGEERGILVHAVGFDSSDHASFIGNGFAAVGVSEEFVSGDFNPYYHTAEDSYQNIDFGYLERISLMAFEVTARAH